MRTGTSGFVAGVPRLSIGINGTPTSGGFNSGPYPVKFAIDGRGSADPADRVRTDSYRAGSTLHVRCQDYGVSIDGSTLWIYTTDGYWVPDAYRDFDEVKKAAIEAALAALGSGAAG
ncbi:hypothetical protein [Catellatospora chokoriensis]|uniref:Uncharacterized protein n=1 Tax=Catellatospora chokoriensis TaxID=310353 RepID=A0A8J3KET4_9ACTN|nr:hypothetical protein [Catellatospora chokoriensis]GIF93744.1 hypothetical protein Cch02nite_71880 [Catellatospora chokoriensis]